MLDKHGTQIKEGDILLGEFFGQGGRWIQKAIVRESDVRGLFLETEGHCLHSFDHPKFRTADRREIVEALHKSWNAIDQWNRENGSLYLIKECPYCYPTGVSE